MKSLYQQARMSRDARFDGKFFICVKTTKIFCRTICPAKLPLEKNVIYVTDREQAIGLGFRPCLRCKPEFAPNYGEISKGSLLYNKASQKVLSGEWLSLSIPEIAKQLNTSQRNLNKIFRSSTGMSAKEYQNNHKSILAKALLQNSNLSLTDIANTCGYSSLSSFYYLINKYLRVNMKSIKTNKQDCSVKKVITYPLSHPYDWGHFLSFQQKRLVEGMEWIRGETYGRTFNTLNCKGHFEVCPAKSGLSISIQTNNMGSFGGIYQKIIKMFDLDVNLTYIEDFLSNKYPEIKISKGLRIPGVFSEFEAGLRAICGQQVTVSAATKLFNQVVHNFGYTDTNGLVYMPLPIDIVDGSNLAILKTVNSKKNTILALATWFTENSSESPEYDISNILSIKGIGPWTLDYIKLRANKDPNIWMGSDLGIKKAIKKYNNFDHVKSYPWSSYLSIQLWNIT
ncbi:DNA-3-methyladenine glycosylase 2 [Xenorhabdus bovienii]|uniref:DNA-3-methyladenine glycosylase 2 n=1 Tax=Xenorhabdus bovienii TaxID=40576 RepID=UPI0023B2ADE0|nr:Ada metal-binding domain-containing protein [Xenorhabdus bovienii]MDE9551411.1 helix-turn-helix domain-containing protein [Xenorhabdus bovienii]